ncbi:hypothetical protein [uncultured Hymenobacter sp.]|uniref:hypothetical protein n=1 Tax=uncultured Hymenobacter sp. TaxID=170016 RepID=UPI0035CA2C89
MADSSELTQILQHLTNQSAQHAQQIGLLSVALERNTSVLETVVTVQNQMLNQVQLIYEEQQQVNKQQQGFNERQEQFNERQEETDAILLSELREIKTDLRELKNVVLTDHEERLRRLEEFMRRAS